MHAKAAGIRFKQGRQSAEDRKRIAFLPQKTHVRLVQFAAFTAKSIIFRITRGAF